MAAHIFDRYLMIQGHWNVPVKDIVIIFTVSILIAAKIEQPLQPSYKRVVKLLNEKEKTFITK